MFLYFALAVWNKNCISVAFSYNLSHYFIFVKNWHFFCLFPKIIRPSLRFDLLSVTLLLIDFFNTFKLNCLMLFNRVDDDIF